MCGIAGLAAVSNDGTLTATVERMTKVLAHRGPDADGVWANTDSRVAFGHRRLAIVDLSPEGAQPMRSGSGRYIITYNGEIYNFPDLRSELEQHQVRFRGRSDTEILLAACDQWGVNAALQRIAGMFAFGLWDEKDRVLHLVRDRIGKKPLYVGWAGQQLIFASELKAFHAHKDFKAEIDRGSLSLYLRYASVPAPHSIYKSVWQLLPGCRLSLKIDGLQPGADLPALMEPYWNLPRVVEDSRRHMHDGTDAEITDEFETLLKKCVSERMMSDVPLGAFLSGGIDSSVIVALMQQQSQRPVKTYSIGFREKGYDEAAHAANIANHLGADHHELYVESKDAIDVIPSLPDIYDEPFADASQIPTYLVSKFARSDVTVALSGDGGDEMLGGYLRHFMVPGLWSRVGWMPRPARAHLARMIRSMPQDRWDRLIPRHPQLGRRAWKFSELLETKDHRDLYTAQVDHWRNADALAMKDGPVPSIPLTDSAWQPKGLNLPEQMIYYDMLSYLPNDLMVKADRASMAVSLEMRAPLLDHRIAEYAWSLPMRFKIRQGRNGMTGKWLLRQVLARHVPLAMFDRPKQGFSVPVEHWLRGPLRDWAQSLLDPVLLKQDGWLDPAMVTAEWDAYLKGHHHHAGRLWTVLMFQAWHQRWHAGARSSAINF